MQHRVSYENARPETHCNSGVTQANIRALGESNVHGEKKLLWEYVNTLKYHALANIA